MNHLQRIIERIPQRLNELQMEQIKQNTTSMIEDEDFVVELAKKFNTKERSEMNL